VASVEGHRLAVGNARLLDGEHVSLDGLAERAAAILSRHGYGNLHVLDGGIAAWTAAGLPVTATRLMGPQTVIGPEALDVRQGPEYISGHLPGARHIELGALPARAADLPDQSVVVMCSHGERAATGASVLERAGRHDVSVLVGGPDEWAAAHATEPETGG